MLEKVHWPNTIHSGQKTATMCDLKLPIAGYNSNFFIGCLFLQAPVFLCLLMPNPCHIDSSMKEELCVCLDAEFGKNNRAQLSVTPC